MGGYVSGTLMSVLQSHVSTALLAMTTSTLTHVTAPLDFLAPTVRQTTRIAQPAHALTVANALMGSTTLHAGACTATLAPIARPEFLPAPTTCAAMVALALRTPTAIRDATASMVSRATGVSRWSTGAKSPLARTAEGVKLKARHSTATVLLGGPAVCATFKKYLALRYVHYS